MIQENASKTAKEIVRADEDSRQAAEKVELDVKLIEADVRRNRWFQWIAIIYVFCFLLICLVLSVFMSNSPWYYLVGGLFFITIVALVFVYKAYHFTTILPINITEEDLEKAILEKTAELTKKAKENIQVYYCITHSQKVIVSNRKILLLLG